MSSIVWTLRKVRTPKSELIHHAHRRLKVSLHVDAACRHCTGTPLHELSEDDWCQTQAVNLTSAFLFSKYAIQQMLKQSKQTRTQSIINMCSVQGLASEPGVCAYATSKGGLLALTRQMSVEYAPYGINVNSISPGTILTPLVKKNYEEFNVDLTEIESRYPLKRLGEPNEVAELVWFFIVTTMYIIWGIIRLSNLGSPLLEIGDRHFLKNGDPHFLKNDDLHFLENGDRHFLENGDRHFFKSGDNHFSKVTIAISFHQSKALSDLHCLQRPADLVHYEWLAEFFAWNSTFRGSQSGYNQPTEEQNTSKPTRKLM